MKLSTLLPLALLAALTACSGGGGSSSTSGTPGTPGGTPVPAPGITILAGDPQTAGAQNGTGPAALFNSPYGVAVDAAGNTYIGDWGNHTIRKITPAGITTTLAGQAGFSGLVDGVGAAARFNHPTGVAVDAAGNVYVADIDNNAIRKVLPDGTVTTLAGGSWGFADGAGAAGKFKSPYSVAVDKSGNVFVSDNGNCAVRKITPAGVVSTLAGSGYSGAEDGVGAAAKFSWPAGVAVDAAGNVIVADMGNDTIRKIQPDGTTSTVAGMAKVSGYSDGSGAVARFNAPWGVALDAQGNLLVSDMGNSTIRRITPAGVVSTVAGIVGSTVVAPGPLPGMVGPVAGIAVAPNGTIVSATKHAVIRVSL